MRIVSCGKGHFYDPDMNKSCPQCALENGGRSDFSIDDLGATEPIQNTSDIGVTQPIQNVSGMGGSMGSMGSMDSLGATMPLDGQATIPPNRSGNYAGGPLDTTFFANPTPTPVQEYDATQPVRSFINPIGHQTSPMLPVVGWLVCIDGPSKGRDYRIHSQNNFIGRSRSMDICIEGDNTISSERSAVLSYDDMNRIFYFAPGQSLNLVRLNGNALMMPMELHAYDELTIGKTKLLFVPLCGERFDWNDR